MAKELGAVVPDAFYNWMMGAILPALAGLAITPLLLYKVRGRGGRERERERGGGMSQIGVERKKFPHHRRLISLTLIPPSLPFLLAAHAPGDQRDPPGPRRGPEAVGQDGADDL
jgi:hypothetical protein